MGSKQQSVIKVKTEQPTRKGLREDFKCMKELSTQQNKNENPF